MNYLKEISKFKTPEQPDYLDYRNNPTERKKNELVKGNLQLVHKIAKKYQNVVDEFTFDDLMQEGTLALYTALDKYEPAKGYKFSTYASWFIMSNIVKFLKENSKNMDISVEEELIKGYGEDMPNSMIEIVTAEEMDMSSFETEAIRKYFRNIEKVLSAREYEVICYLFGYNGFPVLTEKELTKKLDIAESTVRLVKGAALEKLKKYYSNDFKNY